MNYSIARKRYKYYSIGHPQQAVLSGILTGALCIALNIYWLSAIGVGAFSYYLVRLLLETGEDITIENLIMVIASLQWIIGPVLSYQGFSQHYKYYMYVPEEQYMALAVPGVVLFSIGLYYFRPKKRALVLDRLGLIAKGIVNKNRQLPFYLIATGFLFSFVLPHVPASLHFPFHVLSNVKYIGIIYLLFSDRYKNKALILAVSFALSFLSSLNSAMFHDLILWFSFIGMYYAFIKKPSVGKKLLIIGIIIVGIFILQSVKHTYRETLKETGHSNALSKFASSVEQSFDDNEDKGSMENFVNRINQGWIISRIMLNVPNKVPYADGETVLTAGKAAILPRVLFPDKPKAGGRLNYQKYTGYRLTSSTSMGISLLGESYINYGLVGGWIFMLVMGLAFSYAIKLLFLLVYKYPTFWLWLPLVLLHFVKAETELLVQLNFLVKSAILVIAFLFLNKMFLKIKF